MVPNNLHHVDRSSVGRRIGSSDSRHRHRAGSVIITLFVMLMAMVIFFSVYCVKQLQANRQGRRLRAAQQVEKKETVQDQHRWPSPDSHLAFQRASLWQIARQPVTIVEHQTGRVLANYKGAGRLLRCRWREDSQACAVEQQLGSGGNKVWLFTIDGDQVTRYQPADVIEPSCFLPVRDRGLPHRWEHTVGLLGFREDGDLQIDWVGEATLMDHGRPVRTTRAICQFKIRVTPAGELSLEGMFPMGRPQTVAR